MADIVESLGPVRNPEYGTLKVTGADFGFIGPFDFFGVQIRGSRVRSECNAVLSPGESTVYLTSGWARRVLRYAGIEKLSDLVGVELPIIRRPEGGQDVDMQRLRKAYTQANF